MGANHGHPSTPAGAPDARLELRKVHHNHQISEKSPNQRDSKPVRNGTTNVLRHVENGPIKTDSPLVHDLQGSKIPRKELQLPDFLRTDDYQPRTDLTRGRSQAGNPGKEVSPEVYASANSQRPRADGVDLSSRRPEVPLKFASNNHVSSSSFKNINGTAGHVSGGPSLRNEQTTKSSAREPPKRGANLVGAKTGLLIPKKELQLPDFLKVAGDADSQARQDSHEQIVRPGLSQKPRGILVKKGSNPNLSVSQLSLDDPLQTRLSEQAVYSAGQNFTGSMSSLKEQRDGGVRNFPNSLAAGSFAANPVTNVDVQLPKNTTKGESVEGAASLQLNPNQKLSNNLLPQYTIDNSIRYAGHAITASDMAEGAGKEEYTVDYSIRSATEMEGLNSRAVIAALKSKHRRALQNNHRNGSVENKQRLGPNNSIERPDTRTRTPPYGMDSRTAASDIARLSPVVRTTFNDGEAGSRPFPQAPAQGNTRALTQDIARTQTTVENTKERNQTPRVFRTKSPVPVVSRESNSTPDITNHNLRTDLNDAWCRVNCTKNADSPSTKKKLDSVSGSESDKSERTLALQRKPYGQRRGQSLSEEEARGFLDELSDSELPPPASAQTMQRSVRRDPSTSDCDNESEQSARQTPLGHPMKQRSAAQRSNSLQKQLRERLQRFNQDKSKANPPLVQANRLSRHSSFKRTCNDLPDELLLRIFSYLSTRELCKASGVCMRWHDLCWDPILWNGIHINHYPHSNVNRVIKCILTKLSDKTQGVCMTVHAIKLNGCELLSDKGLAHIGHYCIDLEQLDLIGCCCITSKGLQDILANCQNLTRLNIAGCTCVNSITAATLNGMSLGDNVSILHLRHLDISDCVGFDDLGMRSVGISCALLEHLYLRRCPRVTDIGIQHIANHCLTLKELSVSDCYKIRDFSLREIAKRNSSLRYLSVAKCPITDTGIKYIAKHCIKLRYLNVRGCDGVTDIGIAHIAQNCLKLRSLDIGKCGVTDNGLHIIGIHCPQLKKLSLKGCERISEAGIRSIAVQCCSLQYLNVQGCELSYETFVYIRQHCKTCIIEHTCPEFY